MAKVSAQLPLFTPSAFLHLDPNLTIDTRDLDRVLTDVVRVHRWAAFAPQTVFGSMGTKGLNSRYPHLHAIDTIKFMVTPKRMQTFSQNHKCVCCGVEANIALVERHINEQVKPYINLYALTKGGLFLMTVDHILPDSMGGKYSPGNFQTMCYDCNKKKGIWMSAADIKKVREAPSLYAKTWVNRPFLNLMLDLQELMANAPTVSDRNEWTDIFNKYRLKIKAVSDASHVGTVLVAVKHEIEAKRLKDKYKCGTNAVHVRVLAFIKDSFSARAKRWFASIVEGLAALGPEPSFLSNVSYVPELSSSGRWV